IIAVTAEMVETEIGRARITIDANTGLATISRWDGATWVNISTAAFKEIVTDNESETSIVKEVTGTPANGNVQITYDYFNEAQPDVSGDSQETIDMNADVLNLINNNTDIQEAITNVLNQGGNVYFGDHDED